MIPIPIGTRLRVGHTALTGHEGLFKAVFMTTHDQIALYLTAQRLRGRRPRGIDSYASTLRTLCRFLDDGPLDPTGIAAFFAARVHLANATRAYDATVIGQLSAYGQRKGWWAFDLMEETERPRLIRGAPLTAPREAIRRVQRWLHAPPRKRTPGAQRTQRKARLFVALCLYAGLRLSEAVDLCWDDCDLEGEITVRSGKGGKVRWVSVPPPLRAILEETPIAHRRGSVVGYVGRKGAAHVCDRYIRRETGAKISAHMLRRAYALRLDEQGVSVRVIQELLGHASLETTQRYLSIDRNRMRAAVGGIGDSW